MWKRLEETANKARIGADNAGLRAKEAWDKINKFLSNQNVASSSNVSSATALKAYLEKSIDRLHEQIEVLESKTESLHNEVILLRNNQSYSSIRVEDMSAQRGWNSAYSATKADASKDKEVIFLTTPSDEGTFDATTAQTTYKDQQTVYQLTKRTSNLGSFQIVDKDGAIASALRYPYKMIDPVCDSENANSNSRSITTVEQGEAELIENKWKVTKKAKIRYV
ncbi:MAG: hypothetical protein HS105_05470 [Chloracidobacterium sp.]|nr:hypothetical protein [Chloracidobacterium sp.]